MLTEILFLMILIALNAFFAASEMALISLNDNKIRMMAEEGHKKANRVKKLLDEPSRFLATIQIGITLAGFLASAYAAESFKEQLVKLIQQTGIPVPEIWLGNISMFVITVILSYVTLVLGELVPKRLAMKKAEEIAMLAIGPLGLLSTITSPFVKLLTISTNFFVRLFGVDPHADDEKVTEEEIRMMVDVGEEKGAIQEIEKQMINNIFEFNNKTVSDIMTHRTEVIALPVEASLREVIDLINTEKYSRIPVYRENIDDIIGVLHSKDLIQFITHEHSQEGFPLEKFIRPAYFVPSSKRTDELFRDLQKTRTHIAVIIDEYGGTAGIVTIEDLIEEIVGNIFDEYDEEVRDIDKLDEDTYLINGTVSLDAVEDYFDIKLPTEEYDTLSGFVIGQLGRIPGKDEQTVIEYGDMVFKIERVEEKRVSLIKAVRVQAAEE